MGIFGFGVGEKEEDLEVWICGEVSEDWRVNKFGSGGCEGKVRCLLENILNLWR